MTKSSPRILLLDVLKLMTLIAIAILHVNEFVFYKDIFPLGNSSPIWFASSYYARVFTLGGQVLISIIYLLFGLSGKSKKSFSLIALFALVGQLCLTMVFQTLEWDIYFYIAVTNALLLLPLFYSPHFSVIIFSFLFLLIPPGLLQSLTPDTIPFVILTGKITEYNSGSWPLLPWFFIALLFYQLGMRLRSSNFLARFVRSEKFVWPILFALSIPFLGFYYWVPIGPGYYQFSFAQPQHIFWSNFLLFLFIMRLSFLETVQEKLKQSKCVNWISGLYWVRHLGLTYLLSIIYLGIGMNFSNHFEQHPWLFDLFFICLMPFSELAARFMIIVVKFKK